MTARTVSGGTATVDRRAFIAGAAALGGGFMLGLRAASDPVAGGSAGGAVEVSAWIVIRPDDSVIIRVAKSEMGQGTATGLAQLVAEELDCDWSKVSVEYPTPGENLARGGVWGSMFTAGSRGIRESVDLVRKSGAVARTMLVQAAAREWGVPISECGTSNGIVTHPGSGRSVSYGKVAERAATVALPDEVRLKDRKDWTVAGRGVKRLDTPEKTTGRLVYGIDVNLPGMLNATIRACPVFGGRLIGFDEARVRGMKGVRKVVRIGDDAVAVVADTWWHARKALDALPVEWDYGANEKISSASIAGWLEQGLDPAQPAYVGNRVGDARAALDRSVRRVEAVYAYPYQNHLTMEPMNATALFTPEKCIVWCPTQDGDAALAAVAAASGLPVDRCDVHKLPLGGGFGRRTFSDFIRQAVLIAKELPGTPVKLLWTREEDMTHGRYHPITQCRLTGSLDAAGELAALHMRISGQSILAGVRPESLQDGRDRLAFQGLYPDGSEAAIGYTIPNLLIDHSMRNPHVPPGYWRGVNVNQNAIYLECFIDELAFAAGRDPLEFRRRLMVNHPRHRAVLEAAADRIGWHKPAPRGVFRGLAQMMAFGSYVAGAAEISVEDGNRIRIHRMVGATDPGEVVNPAQVERQIAGSFVYGLSALFLQECTVVDGRMEQRNFDTYDSMRIATMPAIESIIMPSGGFWGGVGEPTIAVAAPAVLNAYFRATGVRIRSFPLRRHGITLA
jgi:isoquinoline 1-oxidoreductase beta subunit